MPTSLRFTPLHVLSILVLAGCAQGAKVGAGLDDGGTLGVVSPTNDGGLVISFDTGGGGPVFLDGSTGTGTGTGTGVTTSTSNSTSTSTDAGATSTGTGTGTSTCDGTLTLCAAGCTDTTTDPMNCGACGNLCSTVCVNSMCEGGSSSSSSSSSSSHHGGGGYSCSHSPCETGAALTDDCDGDEPSATEDALVTLICDDEGYPECCTSGWGQECVDAANSFCIFHHEDICGDPGC